MGRMLGSFDPEDELDRPDLNKCPLTAGAILLPTTVPCVAKSVRRKCGRARVSSRKSGGNGVPGAAGCSLFRGTTRGGSFCS